MELFPSFNNEEDFKSERVKPIFNTIEYTLETIIDKINRIDELNPDEIKGIICRQHSVILNYDLFLKYDETRRKALLLFTNEKFLKIFIDINGTLQLSKDEIICINKLAYDYFTYKEKDNKISELLLMLSYQINNKTVIRLSGIVGINGARLLALTANSSFKIENNIKRVNYFIVKSGIGFSVQNIVDIYCILFERFTYVFTYTMFESRPNTLTSEENARFDIISIAILVILDSLTTENIKKVLFNYGYLIKLNPEKIKGLRFSLKSAKQYPRIISSITDVELGDFENIIIP